MNSLFTQRKPLLAMAVAVSLAVLLAGWFLLISPERAKVAGIQSKTAAQNSANSSTRAQIAMLQTLAAQLPQQRAAMAKATAKVPPTAQLPDLVRQLNQTAIDSGVQLTGLTPGPPTAIVGANGVSGIAVTLKVSGDYASLEQFELALEALPRAFTVTGLTISGASGSAAASPATGGAATSSTSSTSSTSTAAASGATSLTETVTGQILVGTFSTAPAAGATTTTS
jgi:Tfp pilus assembly protein PilO